MNIAEINLFLIRSDAIHVTGIVCGELDKLTPAAFCTELCDCLVVYYEKNCAMEAAGEEEPSSISSPVQSGGWGRRVEGVLKGLASHHADAN